MMIDTCVNMQEASVNTMNMNFNEMWRQDEALMLARHASESLYPFAPSVVQAEQPDVDISCFDIVPADKESE